MISTDVRTKVLQMYNEDHSELTDEEYGQLVQILGKIFKRSKHSSDKNYIFWGYICPAVRDILISNGFELTTLYVSTLHPDEPIIKW